MVPLVTVSIDRQSNFRRTTMFTCGRPVAIVAIALAMADAGATAHAQHHGQVAVGTPLQQPSDSFSEQVGVSFNAHGQNWFFQQNAFGGGPAPQFGPAMPGAGAGTGFGFLFPGGSANFNITAGQGATSGLASTATSVTSLNGQSGRFMDVTETPFVMGVVPMVGDRPAMPWSGNPLQERVSRLREGGSASAGIRAGSPAQRALAARAEAAQQEQAEPQTAAGQQSRAALHGPANSSAPQQTGNDAGGGAVSHTIQHSVQQSASASVAELKAMRAAAAAATASAEQREAERLAARASEAEAAGKSAVARIYYQQAARRAIGPLKDEWTARATALAATALAATALAATALAAPAQSRPAGAKSP